MDAGGHNATMWRCGDVAMWSSAERAAALARTDIVEAVAKPPADSGRPSSDRRILPGFATASIKSGVSEDDMIRFLSP